MKIRVTSPDALDTMVGIKKGDVFEVTGIDETPSGIIMFKFKHEHELLKDSEYALGEIQVEMV